MIPLWQVVRARGGEGGGEKRLAQLSSISFSPYVCAYLQVLITQNII